MFDKFRKMNIAHRKTDEALYSVVAKEMGSGVRNNGLWLKALEKAGGNKDKQVAEYIKLRVQSLKDDASILSEFSETAKQISHNLDIEEFVTLLSNSSSLEKIKAYLTGMSMQEISEFINQLDACEEYPIHIAVKKNRTDIARWLLDVGANPDLKNYWGSTALEIAEKKGDQEAIAVLEQYTT
ncbi:MAG: ankyrin repeat domain-containing protein [Alteromonadaceae bacterium]|nr:ankyrin repeat domain-containing protein [Alteromonadaceae bacterium]